MRLTVLPLEAGTFRGNDARCVIVISGGSLEILYNIMQRPVGHDQRAYSTSQGRPLYSNHEAGFFMGKMGGEKFVHIFAKSWDILVVYILTEAYRQFNANTSFSVYSPAPVNT